MKQSLSENAPLPDAATLTEAQRFWFAHVDHCLSSGLSMAAYARQHQLADKSLYHWVKRKREWPRSLALPGAGTATFHRVQMATPLASRSPEKPALWLRLPNGIECEWRDMDTGHCLEVLIGLSRLPA